jgi:hypothetical protein
MQTPLSIALTLWKIGMVSEENLVVWADTQILNQAQPDSDLLEIAANGAVFCLKQSTISTYPFTLNFSQEFWLRAYLLDLTCDRAIEHFIQWVARNCVGEIEIPESSLGYQLDHLYYDCEDIAGAIALLQDKLPQLMPHYQNFATYLLEQVPDLQLG